MQELTSWWQRHMQCTTTRTYTYTINARASPANMSRNIKHIETVLWNTFFVHAHSGKCHTLDGCLHALLARLWSLVQSWVAATGLRVEEAWVLFEVDEDWPPVVFLCLGKVQPFKVGCGVAQLSKQYYICIYIYIYMFFSFLLGNSMHWPERWWDWPDGGGIGRNGGGIGRNGGGIRRNGGGIRRNGVGIRRNGGGIRRRRCDSLERRWDSPERRRASPERRWDSQERRWDSPERRCDWEEWWWDWPERRSD